MINFKNQIRTNDLEMYIAFRNELDAMEFPRMVDESQIAYITIDCDGFDVGFLLVNRGYVIGVYVKPEYRRRGLARNAILEYLKNGGVINSLEILDCNVIARYFWESLFDLKPERYIDYEEYRIGENFNRELIEKKFRELDKELYLSQLKIKNRISTAFDKHFDRNRDKELNKQGSKRFAIGE